MSKILAIYASLLAACELAQDENGTIVGTEPVLGDFKVGDKDFCLPTSHNLRNPNGRMFFHPFGENFLKPESECYLAFKTRLVKTINFRMLSLVENILKIALDKNKSKQPQSPLLVNVLACHDYDEQFLKALASIIKAVLKTRNELFIDLFIKSKGKVGDQTYEAVGKVCWLFAEDLEATLAREQDRNTKTGKYSVAGATVRKSDIEGLLALHRVLFGDKTERETMGRYAVANSFARFFEGVNWTGLTIAAKLNPLIAEINLYNGTEAVKPFPVDWAISYGQNLAEIRKESDSIGNLDRIPMDDVPKNSEPVSLVNEYASAPPQVVAARPPVLPPAAEASQPAQTGRYPSGAYGRQPATPEPQAASNGKIPFNPDRLREQYYPQQRGHHREAPRREAYRDYGSPSVSELLNGDPNRIQRGGYGGYGGGRRQPPQQQSRGYGYGRQPEPQLYPVQGRTDRYGNQIYQTEDGDFVVELRNGEFEYL